MNNFHHHFQFGRVAGLTATLAAVLQLGACGGGSDVAAPEQPRQVATAQTAFVLDVAPQGVAVPQGTEVRPTYQLAPVLLDEPADATSEPREPHLQWVPPENRLLANERLTAQKLRDVTSSDVTQVAGGAREHALATGAAVVTYTPAQIRAAYGFPSLPASVTGLTATQAAELGAGQTVYIIGAYHSPNVAAELAAFNAKFGLPTCTTKTITSVPAPAAGSGCEVSVVSATAAGGLTTAVPAYDAGWATEIALDVQWTHATAPLARLVVVEAADPSVNALVGAIKLANAMGPGVVNMSLGVNEGSWISSYEAAFTGADMTYLAATGDSGSGVSWPAVSPKVLAVSGTSLTYSAGSTRSETTWSGTGGGVSAYTAVPSYQTSAVPGMGTQSKRNVGDVSFNANPSTGQYVATMPAGSTTVSWVSAGGTSMASPQWAGIVAIANAKRLVAGKALLGAPHAVLYGQVATNAANYASGFKDVTTGSNGTCATCVAKVAYDTPTGLGTPNVSALVATLSGVSAPATPPVVTASTISGVAGTALTFTASATGTNALSYSLSGAPAGMGIAATTGVVTWSTPVAGTYSVTVAAKDTVTGLSGSALYTINVTAPAAPAGVDTSVSGQPNVALTFQATFTASNPLTYSMTSAPTGMAINVTTGVVTWSAPVAGTYAVKISAKDSKTGLTGTATYTVRIQAATTTSGPVITANALSGSAGKALTGTISIADPGATSLQLSITGVPLGVGFSISGSTITLNWPSPVAGSYSLNIKVVDNLGRSATAVMPITIAK